MISRFQKIFFFILLLAFNTSAQTDSLQFGGIWRAYILHLPVSYSGTTKLPLMIGLNGLGGTASGFETITGFSTKADAENFIVIYLNGTGSPANWNCGGSWAQPSSMASNNDDVGYISALIDTLSRRYKIDSTRVYAAGLSNGSMMVYRLATELYNKIAAIAAGSGPMTLRTNPSHPVAVIHFHALDDPSIAYAGITDPHAPIYFPPIDTLMAIWRRTNGCAINADTIYNASGVLGRKWAAVSTGADVVLYRATTGSHAWPITGTLAETDIAWNFLKTHSRTSATGTLVHNAHETPQAFSLYQNYPNPFNPTTVISFSISSNSFVSLKVFDLIGREVATIISEELLVGNYSRQWITNGMPSGIYFYRLQAGTYSATKKLVLLK